MNGRTLVLRIGFQSEVGSSYSHSHCKLDQETGLNAVSYRARACPVVDRGRHLLANVVVGEGTGGHATGIRSELALGVRGVVFGIVGASVVSDLMDQEAVGIPAVVDDLVDNKRADRCCSAFRSRGSRTHRCRLYSCTRCGYIEPSLPLSTLLWARLPAA